MAYRPLYPCFSTCVKWVRSRTAGGSESESMGGMVAIVLASTQGRKHTARLSVDDHRAPGNVASIKPAAPLLACVIRRVLFARMPRAGGKGDGGDRANRERHPRHAPN